MSLKTEISKKILAYMFREKQFLSYCSDKLSRNFFPSAYRKLFVIFRSHFLKYRSPLTTDIVKVYLNKIALPQEMLSFYTTFLSEIETMELDEDQFEFYTEQLREIYVGRILKESLGEYDEDTIKREKHPDIVRALVEENKPLKALEIMRDTVKFVDANVSQKDEKEAVLSGTVDIRREDYIEIKNNPELGQGLLTGFERLDEITNGLFEELIVFYGPSGSGKSIAMINIGVNAWEQGKNVIYFSLELSQQKIETRLTSRMSGLKANDIKFGTLSEQAQETYFECLERQKTASNYWLTDDLPRGCTVDYLDSKIEKATINLGPPQLILVDYLELLSAGNRITSDQEAIGNISEQLHEIARYHKVPVVTASQMTSARYKQTRDEVGMHRIARSERVIHNADIAIQIRPTEIRTVDDISDTTEQLEDYIQFFITKNRDNPIDTFMMYKDFERMLLLNIPKDKQKDVFADLLDEEEISNDKSNDKIS